MAECNWTEAGIS